MPTREFTEEEVGIFDPNKADPSLWPTSNEVQVDQGAGELVFRNPVKMYAPNGGELETLEIEDRPFFELAETSLENHIKTNQRGGNGKYVVIFIDGNLFNATDAEIRARKEAAVLFQKRGSVSFESELPGWQNTLGFLVRIIVPKLGIDVTWKIVHVDAELTDPVVYSISLAPRVQTSADDLQSALIAQVLRGTPARRIVVDMSAATGGGDGGDGGGEAFF